MNEFCSDILKTLIGVFAGGLLTIFANCLSNKKQFELNRKLESEFWYKKMILKELIYTKELIKSNDKLVVNFIISMNNYDEEKLKDYLFQTKNKILFELSKIASINPFLEGISEKDKSKMKEIQIKEKLKAYRVDSNKIINIDMINESEFPKAFELFIQFANNNFSYEDSYNDAIDAINKAIKYYIESLKIDK